MNRREDRDAIESTWVIYTPTDGKPLPKLDEVSPSSIIDATKAEEVLMEHFGGLESIVDEHFGGLESMADGAVAQALRRP